MTNLGSTAPHIHGAATHDDLADWGTQPGGQSLSSGRVLARGQPEVGLWVCTPGTWPLAIPRDELCHFIAGRATYTRDSGEVIEVTPGTVVHFPAGWTGTCTVHATIRNTYMLS